jgi:excisionase family DNA binding protein
MRTPTDVESGNVIPAPGPLLVTPEQAGITLSICRTRVYDLLRRGELESVQIGTSRRIPSAALSDYVQRLRGASDRPVTTKLDI